MGSVCKTQGKPQEEEIKIELKKPSEKEKQNKDTITIPNGSGGTTVS